MKDSASARFPGVLILFTVTLLCVTVLSALCVATVKADRAMTERYADTVKEIYRCESRGQRCLAEADEAFEDGAWNMDRLPAWARVEDGVLYGEIEGDGWDLCMAVAPDGEGGTEVTQWTKRALWEEDTSLTLWQED